MKKFVAFLLTALLLLSMTACGNDSQTPAGTDGQKETAGQKDPISTGAPEQTTAGNWGVDGQMSVRVNGESAKIYFQWPHFYGSTAGTGEANEQGDGTLVLADKYKLTISPEDVALKDVYPAYKTQIEKALADIKGNRYSNGAVTLGEGEICTIGEYEVCKYSGKHTYKYNDTPIEHQVVLYATTSKTNGGIIYWLVEDITEDQSAGQLIRDHAEKIILSIQE